MVPEKQLRGILHNAVLPAEELMNAGNTFLTPRSPSASTEQKNLESLSDGSLLTAFQQGDVRAFVALYQRRHLEIYRYILQFMHGDEEMAFDIFQDTFIKIHGNAQSLRDEHNVRAWMYAIARNNCLNETKRGHRHVALSEQHEALDAGDQLLPDALLHHDELSHRLDEAIRLLPANQREAVILREYEGFSYAEIADATRTSVGVIRQRLFRAKQSLRAMLAPFFEDDAPRGKEETYHG